MPAAQTVTIRAAIFETDRGSSCVAVEFDDAACARGQWSTLVHFRNAGHKVRATEYVALVGREFASPVKAVRALAAAELETLPSGGVGLQFADSLLALAE
jgi:hypothetical protein